MDRKTLAYRLRPLVPVAALILLGGCEQNDPPAAPVQKGDRVVSIMSFNVENLFDNEDDPGKDDKAYLPLENKQSAAHRTECAEIEVPSRRDQCLNWDWSDAILEKKLAVVANTILQVNEGKGADIVALQEIENIDILERLRVGFLAEAEYLPGILIEGRDKRGVDVAFLSRLELADEPVLHQITFSGDYDEREADTRGILQANFVLPDGSVLTAYSVHFPAPYHPTEMRVDAYNRLNQLAADLPGNRAVFAAGDFNTTSTEDSREILLDRLVRPYWTVAHEVGCEDCKGTNYYARDDNWSFLDMILWAPATDRGGKTTWRLSANGLQIANHFAEQVRPDGTPKRFAMPDGGGVSDHWPVVVQIELK